MFSFTTAIYDLVILDGNDATKQISAIPDWNSVIALSQCRGLIQSVDDTATIVVSTKHPHFSSCDMESAPQASLAQSGPKKEFFMKSISQINITQGQDPQKATILITEILIGCILSEKKTVKRRPILTRASPVCKFVIDSPGT